MGTNVSLVKLLFISFTAGQTEATLSDVLAFWTGASTIPPLGFSKELEINFVHGDPGRLPVSHTCGLILELTRGVSDSESFASQMKKALTDFTSLFFNLLMIFS